MEDVEDPSVRKVARILLAHDEGITHTSIAEELNIEPKLIRKALYKLQDLELATYRRIRDESTGWINFYWNLYPEKIDQLNEVLNKKKNND